MERVKSMLAARDARWARETAELLEMAKQPVAVGSGWNEYGEGDYLCVSMSWKDGSTRVLRFRRQQDAEAAQQLASAAGPRLDL